MSRSKVLIKTKSKGTSTSTRNVEVNDNVKGNDIDLDCLSNALDSQDHLSDNGLKISQHVRMDKGNKFKTLLQPFLPDDLANQLEHYIHEHTVNTCSMLGVTNSSDARLIYNYTKRLSITYQHLNPNGRIGNNYLLPALKSGQISVMDIAQMDESEMNPKAWLCAQRKATEARQISHGAQKSLTSLIRCGKCGSKTEYEEKQTRSSDEAMTVSVSCPNCGNKFRV